MRQLLLLILLVVIALVPLPWNVQVPRETLILAIAILAGCADIALSIEATRYRTRTKYDKDILERLKALEDKA